jgi:hypothetical protein
MKKWLYDSVRDVDQAPIDRLRQFPREPDMLVYGLRSLGALIIRGLLQIYNHFEIIGHQNLRTNRSLVIVAKSLQSYRHTLPARGVAAAQITSSLSSGRV